MGVRIGVRWLPLCCVGRRRIWLDLSLWAGYKHGASLGSHARLERAPVWCRLRERIADWHGSS